MKTFLKKIYFSLAAPLWRKIVLHIDAISNSQREERAAADQRIQRLEGEIQDLKKLLEAQTAYLSELRAAGLHSMLSRHMVTEFADPKTALSAVGDVLSGMEPAIASSIHNVPADEIISWARILTDKIGQGSSSARNAGFSAAIVPPEAREATQRDIELLENQLVFNHKTFAEREQAAVLEIARLEMELKLEKVHLFLDRVAPGQ